MSSKSLRAFVATLVTALTFNVVANAHAAALEEETFTFVTEEAPPFAFTNNEGKPAGYAVEILQVMLNELNIQGEITIMPWKRAYLTAQNQKNTLLFTLARTPEREKLFKWIGPVAPRDIYLWKLKDRKGVNVKTLEDVKAFKVGAVGGDAAEQQLLDSGFKVGVNLFPVTQISQIYGMLYLNRVDFVYDTELAITYGVKMEGLDPSMLERSLLLSGGLGYYYGFNLNTSDLIVEQFQSELQKIKRNGTFERIVNKYRK